MKNNSELIHFFAEIPAMQASSGITVKLLSTRIVSLENEPDVEFNSLMNDTLILGKVTFLMLNYKTISIFIIVILSSCNFVIFVLFDIK